MTTSTQESTTGAGSAVVAYFADSAAARSAIDALTDANFPKDTIGAAFHVVAASGQARRATEGADVGGSLRESIETTQPHPGLRPTSSFGAANSDDAAVQPNVIGTGIGTGVSGGSRPGPISGSSMAHSGLRSELKSNLPHEEGLDPAGAQAEANPPSQTTKESQDFGTGEGHMVLGRPAERHSYSHTAFENSFAGYGITTEQARYLSHRLGQQGAIVTVHDASRNQEAERILEQHGGEVRFAGAETPPEPLHDGQVELYGIIGRDYPGHLA